MKMKAKDSFYSSETGQVPAGAEFDVDSKARGREYEKRGLADIIEEGDDELTETSEKTAPSPLSKVAEKPANKAAPALANKAAPSTEVK